MPYKNLPSLVCQHCQKEFRPAGYRGPRSKYQPKFCSPQCFGKSKSAPVVQVQCIQCQKVFPRKIWHAEKTAGRGPFCGFRCYGDWQSQNLRGRNNPRWAGGRADNERSSAHWKVQRKRALERDGLQCLRCGTEDGLEVHHRIPWAPNQADPHALDNLATLCGKCHHRLHYLEKRVRALEKLKVELERFHQSLP